MQIAADILLVYPESTHIIGRASQRLSVLSQCVLLLCTLIMSSTAHSAIHACPRADGGTVYQDSPCPVVQKPAKAKQAAPIKKIPLGIHASWFDSPESAPDRAFCSPRGCDCGRYYWRFKSGLNLAIADALYMDGSWHRLEIKQLELENLPARAPERYDIQDQVDEAACHILMSQQTLRKFSDRVLVDLRKQKRKAEEYGYDDPAACEEGNSDACRYYDAVSLYSHILQNINALKRARNSDTDFSVVNAEDE